MPSDQPPDVERQRENKTITDDARSWSRQFVKHLELEFTSAASQLPSSATWEVFRRIMMASVVNVLRESGGQPTEIARLLNDNARNLLPINKTVEWTSEKNARRLDLIDKSIQRILSADESIELDQLTEDLRTHCDTEEMVPLEGARRLHRELLGLDDSGHTPA